MTIEELTSDVALMEKMSDEELENYFKPYFCVTRPDPNKKLQEKKQTKVVAKQYELEIGGRKVRSVENNKNKLGLEEAKRKMQAAGMDIGDLLDGIL